MWKIKNSNELEVLRKRKENSYKKPWIPLFMAFLLFMLLTLIKKVGFVRERTPLLDPISWKSYFDNEFMIILIISIVAFLILYYRQAVLRHKVFDGARIMICLKCEKTKKDDKNNKCDCGGEYVPLDECDWIEDEKSS